MNDTSDNAADQSLDLEAVRQKYREERDKRLRADGEAQYVRAAGKFARYLDADPNLESKVERDAVSRDVEVMIIGGGFSGLMAGAHLRKRGITDFCIVEVAGDFGGVWYWNRYPGAQCDIEGYIYLPLLEETGYIPKEKYSAGSEIFEHCQRVGRHFDLYEQTYFQTKVTGLSWNDARKRWTAQTNRGDQFGARFVIHACGVGGRAKLPGIPGIEDFGGPSFHTARWDFGVTGGDPRGRWEASDDGSRGTERLDKLADKTVAVIGTGATAIQCVPYVARDAKRTYVFQRTPNAVAPRGGNPPTDAAWANTLAPGWQKQRRENFEDVTAGVQVATDLVDDCWTHLLKKAKAILSKSAELSGEQMMLEAEIGDYWIVKQIHDEIDAIVTDKNVAAALKPYYRPGCKRPGYNDEYLQAFNDPKLTLVDVANSKGVERITKDAVIANGVEYKVDVIVFATGFEIAITDFRNGIGFDVVGREGESLLDHWGDGITSLHGFATRGFPNWFYVGFSQNGFGFNQGYMLDEQISHIVYIIGETLARGAKVVEVSAEAEKAWDANVRKMSRINRDFLENCTPGFYNNEGHLRGGVVSQAYAPGVRAFNRLIESWREEGKLAGYELSE